MTVVTLLSYPQVNFGQAAPDLGAASSFALFTSVGAFNLSGPSDVSYVTGDVGTNAGAFYGFPPGTLIGQKHVADAVTAQAATDLATAYGYLSTLGGSVLGVTLGSGQILTPGVYNTGAASTLTGDLTLDAEGDPNALFIIRIGGAFATGTYSNVFLINGASLCNVYWQVMGAFTLGDYSVFRGTVIASGQIELLEGSSLLGRALTTAGAILLHNNIVTIATSPEASTIYANGATSFCFGEDVILSGNVGGTWSTGATTASITVNTSGDYYVTNTNDCGSVISNIITVSVYPELLAIDSHTNVLCNGGNTGTVTLTFSGGTPPYMVNFNGGGFVTQTSPKIYTDLAVGTYTWIVQDANLCQQSGSEVVGQPAVMVATDAHTDV